MGKEEINFNSTELLAELPIDSERGNLVGQYLNEISKIPLLGDREKEVFIMVLQGREAEKSLIGNSKNNSLSEKEKNELIVKVEEGKKAQELFVCSNLRLVPPIAKRFIGHGLDFLDLIEEGNLGLLKAIEKFDLQRKCKFSTYATPCIRQKISRALFEQGRTIKLPVYLGEQIVRLNKKTGEMTQQFGREPTGTELAEALSTTEERIVGLKNTSTFTLSFEDKIKDEDDQSSLLEDFVSDTNKEVNTAEELVIVNSAKSKLEQIFSTLNPSEKTTIELLFGFEDNYSYTLEEISNFLGVSVEEVKEHKRRALNKFREITDLKETLLELSEFLPEAEKLSYERVINRMSKHFPIGLVHKIRNSVNNNSQEEINPKLILNQREREILDLYFQVDGCKDYTLQDIGDKYGLTRERIRQIKVGALEKLGLSTKTIKN